MNIDLTEEERVMLSIILSTARWNIELEIRASEKMGLTKSTLEIYSGVQRKNKELIIDLEEKIGKISEP